VIEFLCPNNHRIRCPDDQAGNAAKCPKCGVKFVIPSNGNSDSEATDPANKQVLEDELLNSMSDSHLADSRVALDAPRMREPEESSGVVIQPLKPSSSIKTSAATSARLTGSASATCSMAKLFATLWAEKPKDAILELIMRNGEVYKPDMYSRKMSLQQQGVFALKEMDGSFTLTAVSWDALSHIQIRKLRSLPSDFEK
jgi:hypothetical protein